MSTGESLYLLELFSLAHIGRGFFLGIHLIAQLTYPGSLARVFFGCFVELVCNRQQLTMIVRRSGSIRLRRSNGGILRSY